MWRTQGSSREGWNDNIKRKEMTLEKSHTLLELEKIEEKYRAEYLQAESIWNVSRNNMIRQALKEGWSYPITELERYTGKRIDEIAVVFCNEDGLRRKVKILNTDSDNFISVKDSGYLDWISVNSWGDIEAEDYEEYIFSEDVGNGIMMCSDTGECIAGFLWISLAGETKRRGYVGESL